MSCTERRFFNLNKCLHRSRQQNRALFDPGAAAAGAPSTKSVSALLFMLALDVGVIERESQNGLEKVEIFPAEHKILL